MYTDPQDLSAELARRRKDKGLADAVLEYFGGSLPVGWPEGPPIATLNRYLATGRFEDIVFAHSAVSLGLRPYWPTYLAEKYTSVNAEKVSCLRPRVQRPKMQVSRQWLVQDPRSVEGLPLGEILVGRACLPAVHALARGQVLTPEVVLNTFDVSHWNQEQAQRFGARPDADRLAPHYYHAVMAQYVCHGVLFEDFDGGPNANSGLSRFVQEVVNPAITSVTSQFGLKPLIVRLPYIAGFLDFPAACATAFDQFQE
jgi:hypothetical protein